MGLFELRNLVEAVILTVPALYADPGYATVYKVTDHVLAELLGRTPSLYTPPRTQFITEKGDVVDAPLIKAPGKAGGPHRK